MTWFLYTVYTHAGVDAHESHTHTHTHRQWGGGEAVLLLIGKAETDHPSQSPLRKQGSAKTSSTNGRSNLHRPGSDPHQLQLHTHTHTHTHTHPSCLFCQYNFSHSILNKATLPLSSALQTSPSPPPLPVFSPPLSGLFVCSFFVLFCFFFTPDSAFFYHYFSHLCSAL